MSSSSIELAYPAVPEAGEKESCVIVTMEVVLGLEYPVHETGEKENWLTMPMEVVLCLEGRLLARLEQMQTHVKEQRCMSIRSKSQN